MCLVDQIRKYGDSSFIFGIDRLLNFRAAKYAQKFAYDIVAFKHTAGRNFKWDKFAHYYSTGVPESKSRYLKGSIFAQKQRDIDTF